MNSTSFETIAATDDIDGWLLAAEKAFPDIRPGLAKEIVWADRSARRRTPLAIVYVHGFSASKGEVRPLPDRVSAALGANLFYTRLAGHGRTGDAMAEASLADWQADMVEALGIGARLGDRTLVIATSTGAALACWALAQPALAERIAGAVFLAPNFRVRNRGAFLLTIPFGGMLSRLILGRQRSFTPLNALHGHYWTTRYPVSALLPMARIVRIANALAFEAMRMPALFIHAPDDQVVDARRTLDVAGRWGAPATVIDPGAVGDPNRHVVAGDALSPATTETLADVITKWIRKIL